MFKGIFLFLLYWGVTFAQSEHGGLLYSDFFSKKPQTDLDLTNQQPVIAENYFSIEFDFSVWSTKPRGTILFLRDKTFAIDISFAPNLNLDTAFIIVSINQRELAAKIPFAKKDLRRNDWHRLNISLNSPQSQLIVEVNNIKKFYKKKLPSSYEIDILSGVIRVSTNDVPRVAIRKVKVKSKNEVLRYWKLNESFGNRLYDSIDDSRFGTFKNAELLTAKHFKFEKVIEFNINEELFDAGSYNKDKHEMYIFGIDTLTIVNTLTQKIEKKKLKYPRPVTAFKSFYNPFNNKIYSFFVGVGKVSQFNFDDLSWSYIDTSKDKLGHYFNHTNFIDFSTGELYAVGGYGWWKAKNTIQKYNVKTNNWDSVAVNGDKYFPRFYNSSAHGADSNFVYFFAGYGNESGDQALGFAQVNDLMEYNIKEKTLRKMYSFKPEPFMWEVNVLHKFLYMKEDDSFLELFVKPNKNSNKLYDSSSWIKLVKFSRTKPGFTVLSTISGKDLEYGIHNMYYDETLKEIYLFGVKIHKGYHEVSIFRMLYPPIKEEKNPQLYAGAVWYQREEFYYLSGGFLVLMVILYIKIRQKKNQELLHDDIKLEFKIPKDINYKINLFGKFNIQNDNDENVTSLFASKAKQLFLIILLHTAPTLKKVKGIASEELSSILWPDADTIQAKNNRNASISRLRSIMSGISYLEIVYEENLWMIASSTKPYCDFHHYIAIRKKIMNNEVTLQEAEILLGILNKGTFLEDTSYEWLDPFQNKIFNEVIRICENLSESEILKNNAEAILRISEVMLLWDVLNENAMKNKIRALNNLGRIGEMNSFFENYKEKYKGIVGTEFGVALAEVIGK